MQPAAPFLVVSTEQENERSQGDFRGLAWNQHGQLAGISESGDVVIWDADGQIIHDIVEPIRAANP